MTSRHTGGKEPLVGGAREKQGADEVADRAKGVIRSSPVTGSREGAAAGGGCGSKWGARP